MEYQANNLGSVKKGASRRERVGLQARPSHHSGFWGKLTNPAHLLAYPLAAVITSKYSVTGPQTSPDADEGFLLFRVALPVSHLAFRKSGQVYEAR